MFKIEQYLTQELGKQHFSNAAFAVIDFEHKKFKSTCYSNLGKVTTPMYFDLASLTKSLTLGALYIQDPKNFSSDMILALEHRAGLPVGGRLSRVGWKEQILSYPIKESPSLYSDYSILRVQLELEKKIDRPIKEKCLKLWDKELCFWKDLAPDCEVVATGTRNWKIIQGEVHDDNAFVINEFVCHAGLFSTIEGLARTLLKMDQKIHLLEKVSELFDQKSHRYLKGFDTVENPQDTLAGVGAGPKTFGHTGFTGTSYWIDCDKKKGHILLTNATQNYWYDKTGLNTMRKDIGQMAWEF